MSLRTIVETLGGEVYDRGRRANIPAPGHSSADRSVSLLLQGDRIIVHTFGDGDWRAVLDHLRAHNLIDARGAPTSVGAAREAIEQSDVATHHARREAARRLWEGGRAIRRTLSERHCRVRGVTRDLPGDEVLRHNGEAPVSVYRAGRQRRPALLAAILTADGQFTAVEVTYLVPNGRRAELLKLSRKTVGLAPAGCAIRLDPAGPDMLVAEGMFTTLSASEWFRLPGWALTSTRNLRVWTPPAGVRSLLIAADRGKDGEASAERLRARMLDIGVAARVALPPQPWGDWNDWSEALGPGGPAADERMEEGRDGVRPGAG